MKQLLYFLLYILYLLFAVILEIKEADKMYISRYDTKFLTFMNRKYKKHKVNFEFIDDYRLWLYYDYLNKNETLYYKQLEKDIEEYSDFQTGRERDKRDRLDGRWNIETRESRTKGKNE